MGAFDVELSHERLDEAVVVRVAGEIDVYTHPKVRDYLKAEVLDAEELPAYVGLEISGVEWFDSCALGVFVGFQAAFRKLRPSGGLVIVGPTEKTRKIFEITGLVKVFPLVESQEAFLAAVASGEAAWAVGGAPNAEDFGGA
ncbi:STAS domain-containing protein [Streptomyces sp. NPDC017260]|uniref:STAS domain-containing protein n=1 Tax=unclassified Streptomyces TaxID=2593676 RepID=UPI0037A92699